MTGNLQPSQSFRMTSARLYCSAAVNRRLYSAPRHIMTSQQSILWLRVKFKNSRRTHICIYIGTKATISRYKLETAIWSDYKQTKYVPALFVLRIPTTDAILRHPARTFVIQESERIRLNVRVGSKWRNFDLEDTPSDPRKNPSVFMFSPSDGTDWMVIKSGVVVRYSQAQMEDLNYGGGVYRISWANL